MIYAPISIYSVRREVLEEAYVKVPYFYPMWIQFQFVYKFRHNSTAVLKMLDVSLQLVYIDSKMTDTSSNLIILQ
jgi:hypothetical protein